MTAVRIKAPAKINLCLHVTGRRPDGYHTLESLVAFTDFGDTLEIMPADTLTLNVTGPFADALHISKEQNLVMQAASMLRLRTGSTTGARMVLHKQIPVSAGLGGGSSDAAAALKALYRFWRIDSEDDRVLERIALKLGSDVPACLAHQAAWIRGAGEEVKPVSKFPEVFLVLVKPEESLLTRDIYQRFGNKFSFPSKLPDGFISLDSLVQAIQPKHNDLHTPAIDLLPVIHNVLGAIHATRGCLLSRMSGSGPTCFGVYSSQDEAEQAAAELRQTYSTWWCMATRLHDWRNAA